MGNLGRMMLLIVLPCISACRGPVPPASKSVSELQRELRSANPDVQAQALYGLSCHGIEARPSIALVIDLLSSPEIVVRQNAALVLARIGPEARAAVPALTAVLRDPAWQVRRQAALALASIGADARPALAELQLLQHDPEPLVQDAADTAVAKLQP
jgi:vesicle coat complex subunit